MSRPDTSEAQPTITQFTDPMCTWCWGAEPIIRRLRTVYGDQLRFEYVMGGLVEDFEDFYDAVNDIATPADVAPHWLEASEHHGMPVDVEIFESNPARSTYPASVAFVAARQTNRDLAHPYLRHLREAYATQVRNINERDVQVELAQSVGLDVEAFTTALDDGSARTGFERDLSRTREASVHAFPTYQLRGPEGTQRTAGFTSFDELAGLLQSVAPSLDPSSPPPIRRFIAEHGAVATREVAEVYGLDDGKARQVLESLAGDGHLTHERRGNGRFWRVAGGGAV